MSTYTKLIIAGAKVAIYDGEHKKTKGVCEHEERADMFGGVTVENLIMTNFSNTDIDARYITFKANSHDLKSIKMEVTNILDKMKRRNSYIKKHLVVIEPGRSEDKKSIVHLIIDSWNTGFSEEELETLAKDCWVEDIIFGEDMALHFKRLMNKIQNTSYRELCMLPRNLEKPTVLLNRAAEARIKELRLYNYEVVDTEDFYDKSGGSMKYTEFLLS